MTQLPVSVFIITLNEQTHLRRLLPQLQRFNEVVIVDSGSSDGTEEVARCFANVRFQRRAWNGFGEQKQFALSLCQQPWLLNLDADEEMTPEFLQELEAAVDRGDFDALACQRILLRWGRRPRSVRPEQLVRFFRRGHGVYSKAKVHERLLVAGRVRNVKAALLHHENLGFSQRVQKSNQYSQLKAEDKFSRGQRCHVLHLLLVFPVAFLQCYFGKRCLLDGVDGIVTSMHVAYYQFMKYAKLRELQQRQVQSVAESPEYSPG